MISLERTALHRAIWRVFNLHVEALRRRKVLVGWWHRSWRVHSHFKLCRGLEGADLAVAGRFHLTALLLVARRKFKSASAAQLAARTAICGLTPQQISLVLLRDHLRVVEVVKHQVHVLLRLRCQVRSLKVLLVLIDGDTDPTCRDIAGCPGSLWQLFLIIEELGRGASIR